MVTQKTSKSLMLYWRVFLPSFVFVYIGCIVWASLYIANILHDRWSEDLKITSQNISEELQNYWIDAHQELAHASTFEDIQNIPLVGFDLFSEEPEERLSFWDGNEKEGIQFHFHKPHQKGAVFQFDVEKYVTSFISEKLKSHLLFHYVLTSKTDILTEGVWAPKSFTSSEINKLYSQEIYQTEVSFGHATLHLNWRFMHDALTGVPWVDILIFALSAFVLLLVFIGFIFSLGQQNKRPQKAFSERLKEYEVAKNRFHIVSDNAYDLILILRLDNCMDYANSAMRRILGYHRENVLSKPFLDMVHTRDRKVLEDILSRVRHGDKSEEMTIRLRHKNGSWVYLECICSPVHDNHWVLANIVVHARDISVRKKYADNLARSEQRFRDFADSSADWLWEVNDKAVFTYISPGITKTLGYNPEDILGKNQFDILFDVQEDITKDLVKSRVDRFQPYRDIEFWTRSKRSERICLRVSGVPVFDERHTFLGYRGAATNITTSKLDRENMFRLATTDHLTGLLNRARFHEELDRHLNICHRQHVQGALVFLDLDQFKSINDTYGHDAGDTLLMSVSKVLRDAVRVSDIVSRLGGDEFGIIMHDISLNVARQKIEKMIEDLNALEVPYQDTILRCTMSVGLVTYSALDSDSTSLLMRADLAMYRAKDMGRNRLYVAGDSQDDVSINAQENEEHAREIDEHKHSMREQLKWVERLKLAINQGAFEMYYQPLVPAEAKKMPHFEALIRVKDKEGNLGSPGIVIEAAENHGLIKELDMKVIERCIEQQLEMKEKGYPSSISMNLSGKSLADPEIVERLKQLIHKYPKLDPKDFTFEVTETAALHDPKAIKQMEKLQVFIDSLRQLGFKFALDDFGTGFSSFNYIKYLNVDCIKIDGSFILPLENSHQDRLFVKAITDLAKGLNISTVAEFVENESILSTIKSLGVDNAQGYHLSKPDPDLEMLCKEFFGKEMQDFQRRT